MSLRLKTVYLSRLEGGDTSHHSPVLIPQHHHLEYLVEPWRDGLFLEHPTRQGLCLQEWTTQDRSYLDGVPQNAVIKHKKEKVYNGLFGNFKHYALTRQFLKILILQSKKKIVLS